MQRIIDSYNRTKSMLDEILSNESFMSNVRDISMLCVEAINNGNKVMFCGNGGSAADSQHLAGELVSKFKFDRPGLYGIALTVDTSILTAAGNDYGYDKVFARQVDAIGREGDVLFGFSTSGRSKNIIEAFNTAKSKNITTIGMLGRDGRYVGEIADYQINIPSSETPHIQEGHITTGHIICGLIEEEIFGGMK